MYLRYVCICVYMYMYILKIFSPTSRLLCVVPSAQERRKARHQFWLSNLGSALYRFATRAQLSSRMDAYSATCMNEHPLARMSRSPPVYVRMCFFASYVSAGGACNLCEEEGEEEAAAAEKKTRRTGNICDSARSFNLVHAPG